MTNAFAAPSSTDSERINAGAIPHTSMVNSMALTGLLGFIRARDPPRHPDDSQGPALRNEAGFRLSPEGRRLVGAVLRNAFVGEHLLKLARLEHLGDNVAAADELALDIKLRDRRPIGIGLDALAQLVAFENVDPFEGHADMIEDLNDATREAAHRDVGGALHEQHDVVRLHLIVDDLI